MKITIPELSLVVLIGPSGSGKSTFAQKHFKPTEILSSDFCRGLVSDDENDQTATPSAFEILSFIGAKRLAAGKLTVVDATNVQLEARKPLVALAREFHTIPVAIVFILPEALCHNRNRGRADRNFGPHVIRQQVQQLHRSLRTLKKEGFRHIFYLKSLEEIESVVVERQPLWNNLRQEHGPFDIIGDIHGCCDELLELLERLGYDRNKRHPENRKVVFLGDLVDRGPATPSVLRIVMEMVLSHNALCVPGNHDIKLMRKLRGMNVNVAHGLNESLMQLKSEPKEFEQTVVAFIDGLISHYVLDDGKLVVAHAGMKESLQGRGSGIVREFALFGETTGETDEYGLPVRYNWATEYRGRAMVVYGHTPVPEPEWLNKTICIDTGCVFGGRLTALRYPELELISVPARRVYCKPAKPFIEEKATLSLLSAQQQHDDLLDIDDVIGKRIVSTRLRHNITVRMENAIAALEVMSRFAANPKWIIYLPPTMSPAETSDRPDMLEDPEHSFSYYRSSGISKVVCEEKHMGSRAVVIVCKNEEVARKRFGVADEGVGICYTRTGRRFFGDSAMEGEFLSRVRDAMIGSSLWEELKTDWICLDCELMPWSAKAMELLRQQYAAVGSAAHAALPKVIESLRQAARNTDLDSIRILQDRYQNRLDMVTGFTAAYRRYCWSVMSIEDLKLAPFHILATEGRIYVDRDHVWHMETLARLCEADSRLFRATRFMVADLKDVTSQTEANAWWERLTESGGEGMVIKPFDFIARGRHGLVQPAIKCRSREYLRLIYGPEYTAPEHIMRLRGRALAAKRSLAIREFALGIEALERFVRKEPLRSVHECVFSILALESEPVDPRL